jgi:hypothetical protein
MPAVTDYAPPGAQAFGSPTVDVGPLYVPTPAYIVRSLAQETRRAPDGRIIATIAVSFIVPGAPGDFVIHIDNYAFTHVDVLEYMRERSYLIHQLYALPEQLPSYADAVAAGAG